MTTLMVQGTTSDAGKSTLVTALCRWATRQGVAVVPFKPQNMALNSAVTADGGEIGRAQAVQAQAAFLEPHTDMNPVLLKPNSDTGAQVIIHGRAVTSMNAVAYHDYKAIAMQAVLASHQRLSAAYPLVMVEGAGSPAEINLRAGDIANMGFAEAVDCPVLLIADINRGGVFAHLVGTLELLSPSEQARVKGFIINRFRGDIALLQPGLDWLEQRTGKPVVGVLALCDGSASGGRGRHRSAPDRQGRTGAESGGAGAAAHQQPHRFRSAASASASRPAIRRPGAGDSCRRPDHPAGLEKCAQRSRVSARQWLGQQPSARHLRYGGKVLGICGGLQMLGEQVHDPLGLEGAPRFQCRFGLAGVRHDAGSREAIAQCAWAAGAGRRRGQRL